MSGLVAEPSLAQGLAALSAAWSEQLTALGVAWLRVLPLVLLVPAFGLSALPFAARVVFAAALGLGAAPALVGVAHPGEPSLELAVRELLLGTPFALGTATLLWAATMAGDFFAEVNGSSEPTLFATVPGPSSAYGTLLSLLASLAFLELGGPGRAVKALAALGVAHTDLRQLLTLVVQQVGDAIDLAVMIALPLVGVALAVQVAWALWLRLAQPLALAGLLPALRSLAVLAVFALLFQSLAWALVERVELGLP